jgi:FeS assembly protein IscX
LFAAKATPANNRNSLRLCGLILVAFERYKHNKLGGEVDMGLKWVDSLDIAIELNDKFPDVDPMHVNFVDLRNWVLELDEFDDDPEHSGERILEAIQMAWIEEKE